MAPLVSPFCCIRTARLVLANSPEVLSLLPSSILKTCGPKKCTWGSELVEHNKIPAVKSGRSLNFWGRARFGNPTYVETAHTLNGPIWQGLVIYLGISPGVTKSHYIARFYTWFTQTSQKYPQVPSFLRIFVHAFRCLPFWDRLIMPPGTNARGTTGVAYGSKPALQKWPKVFYVSLQHLVRVFRCRGVARFPPPSVPDLLHGLVEAHTSLNRPWADLWPTWSIYRLDYHCQKWTV